MKRLVCLLAIAAFWGAAGSASGAAPLRYRGEPGRIAVYRLTLSASGEQVSLGERRPVRLEAEVELREEVLAVSAEGVMQVRATGRALSLRDRTGTFGQSDGGRWPAVEVSLTPRGEVVASAPAGQVEPGPAARAFAALLAMPAAVVLPEGPVAVGQSWTWNTEGCHQDNRLIASEDGGRLARVVSTVRAPVSLREQSPVLGVSTALTGTLTQTSRLDLDVSQGLVARHRGQMRLETAGEVTLGLPKETVRNPITSRLTVRFDLRLLRVEQRGRP